MTELLILGGVFAVVYCITKFVLKSGGIAGGC